MSLFNKCPPRRGGHLLIDYISNSYVYSGMKIVDKTDIF